MYKILKADKDTYITNRVINESGSYNSNVGLAGSLDLFKLYGSTFTGVTPNVEYSRLLLHFDISTLSDLYSSGKIDITHPSFFAKLQLSDVYGGQPTPSKYTLIVNPLSKSFDEGAGKDVVYYSDYDNANFFTASYSNGDIKWINAGCGSSGDPTVICDYYTGSLQTSQYFSTGEEDLNVDVTSAISGVLAGVIPDSGFRVSYSSLEEGDQKTYFVKRFASRHAFDSSKHPRLIVGFDDSIRDTSEGMTFDSNTKLFFFNYDKGIPTNLSTITGAVTGSNCLLLKLQLAISGGIGEFIFTGSQHYSGINPVEGVYSTNVYLSSSNPNIVKALAASGSILKFTPVWSSLNENTTFQSGSYISVREPIRGTSTITPKKFDVTVYGLNEIHRSDETPVVRVNIFDYTTPLIKVTKTPVNSPGAFQGIVSDAFYSIRDAVTQKVIIPFDSTKGSTRISSDASGLFFKLDMTNLLTERTYVVDVIIKIGGETQKYLNASPVFKVSDLQ
jgi:hypothetical protein